MNPAVAEIWPFCPVWLRPNFGRISDILSKSYRKLETNDTEIFCTLVLYQFQVVSQNVTILFFWFRTVTACG